MKTTPINKFFKNNQVLIEQLEELRINHPSDLFYKNELEKIIRYKLRSESKNALYSNLIVHQVPYFEQFFQLRNHVGLRLLPWSKKDFEYYEKIEGKLYQAVMTSLAINLKGSTKFLSDITGKITNSLINNIRLY